LGSGPAFSATITSMRSKRRVERFHGDRAALCRLELGRADGLVFGRTATAPFTDSWALARAEGCWAATVVGAFLGGEPIELVPLSLHECRHTFASLMIDAGVNAKALSTCMGHSSIQITLDRYRHLMPGNEDEAAALLDRYLEASSSRIASASSQ
jgi:integrase